MANFKVQSGGLAGIITTDRSNHFIPADAVTRTFKQLVVLTIKRHQATAMINNNEVSIATQVIRVGYFAGAHRTYGAAGCRSNDDAIPTQTTGTRRTEA